MQDFIQMVTEQIGVPQESAAVATGGVLQMLQQQVPAGQFQELLAQVPGAEALLPAAPPAEDASPAGGGLMGMAAGWLGGGSGGGLGALEGEAGSLIGGQAGAALQLMGLLQRVGIDPGKAASFITMLLSYLRDKLGTERLQQLLTYVPALQQYLGG